jgi:uncharacterized protein (DUF433 family)
MSQTAATHIVVRATRSGEARTYVAGTRVRVFDIYSLRHDEGLTPEEIVQSLPSLTLGQIYAALSYYYDHRQEIEREVEESIRAGEELKRVLPPGPVQSRRLGENHA